MPRRFTPLLLTAVLVLGGACASPRADDGDLAGAGDADAVAAQARELLRVIRDAVGAGHEPEELLIARANARLVTECLQAAGVDYRMPDPAELDSGPPLDVPEGPELWLSAPVAFGAADAVSDASVRRRLAESHELPPQPQPPDGFEEAYWGDPPQTITVETYAGDAGEVPIGGCFGDAHRRLYGVDPAEYERTRASLHRLHGIHREVTGRRDVAEATRAWSRCMRGRGIDVASPDELPHRIADALVPVVEHGRDPESVRVFEAALAADDAACKDSSNLRTEYAHAFVFHAEGAIAELEGAMVAYREMLDHAIEVGHRLFSEEP